MLDAVPIRRVIGENVRRVRENRGMSQPEFGKLVGEFATGKREGWSRQTVSALERGDRAFTVDDLLLLAYVLEVPVSALLLIPPEVRSVTVGIRSFGPAELGAAGWRRSETTETLDALYRHLSDLFSSLRTLGNEAWTAMERAGELQRATGLLRNAHALEDVGEDGPEDLSVRRAQLWMTEEPKE